MSNDVRVTVRRPVTPNSSNTTGLFALFAAVRDKAVSEITITTRGKRTVDMLLNPVESPPFRGPVRSREVLHHVNICKRSSSRILTSSEYLGEDENQYVLERHTMRAYQDCG